MGRFAIFFQREHFDPSGHVAVLLAAVLHDDVEDVRVPSTDEERRPVRDEHERCELPDVPGEAEDGACHRQADCDVLRHASDENGLRERAMQRSVVARDLCVLNSSPAPPSKSVLTTLLTPMTAAPPTTMPTTLRLMPPDSPNISARPAMMIAMVTKTGAMPWTLSRIVSKEDSHGKPAPPGEARAAEGNRSQAAK